MQKLINLLIANITQLTLIMISMFGVNNIGSVQFLNIDSWHCESHSISQHNDKKVKSTRNCSTTSNIVTRFLVRKYEYIILLRCYVELYYPFSNDSFINGNEWILLWRPPHNKCVLFRSYVPIVNWCMYNSHSVGINSLLFFLFRGR